MTLKKNVICFIFSIVFFVSLQAVSSELYTSNLLQNAGFEEGQSNWEDIGLINQVGFVPDSYEGGKAWSVTDDDFTKAGYVCQKVSAISGKRYTATVWARAFDGYVRFWLSSVYPGTEDTGVCTTFESIDENTWKEYKLYCTPNSDRIYLCVGTGPARNIKGAGYFDKASLITVLDPTKEVGEACSTFEECKSSWCSNGHCCPRAYVWCCGDDSDCPDGRKCDEDFVCEGTGEEEEGSVSLPGIEVPETEQKKANGEFCSSDSECESGNCNVYGAEDYDGDNGLCCVYGEKCCRPDKASLFHLFPQYKDIYECGPNYYLVEKTKAQVAKKSDGELCTSSTECVSGWCDFFGVADLCRGGDCGNSDGINHFGYCCSYGEKCCKSTQFVDDCSNYVGKDWECSPNYNCIRKVIETETPITKKDEESEESSLLDSFYENYETSGFLINNKIAPRSNYYLGVSFFYKEQLDHIDLPINYLGKFALIFNTLQNMVSSTVGLDLVGFASALNDFSGEVSTKTSSDSSNLMNLMVNAYSISDLLTSIYGQPKVVEEGMAKLTSMLPSNKVTQAISSRHAALQGKLTPTPAVANKLVILGALDFIIDQTLMSDVKAQFDYSMIDYTQKMQLYLASKELSKLYKKAESKKLTEEEAVALMILEDNFWSLVFAKSSNEIAHEQTKSFLKKVWDLPIKKVLFSNSEDNTKSAEDIKMHAEQTGMLIRSNINKVFGK